MWTQRGESVEKKERVRVLVRIHTAALHSCVIEFPSAHWSGFSLLMAGSVCERERDRESERHSQSSLQSHPSGKRKNAKRFLLLR